MMWPHFEKSDQIRIFTEKIRIMLTKLTLSVDKSVIERAKAYAKQTGRSLSELVGSYLESITREETEFEVSLKLKQLIGSVTLPADFNEEEELRAARESKHLR
jgi:hypothetical protein